VRILITGGAGFIGSHLCDRLLNENHQVAVIDNLITGSLDNIEHLFGRDDFEFFKHDVSNFIFIPGKLDAVMHFASPASPNADSPFGYPNLPIQTLKVGSLGTHNAIGVAHAHKARFLLASTSEVYGDPQEHQRFAEAITMAYHRYHDLDTRIVRIFNTYGPRMRLDDGRVVPNFICQAIENKPLSIYGDGKQTRSFCYVDDLVEGIYRLLMSDFTDPVNIGNPNEMTILELANEVNALTRNKAGITVLPDSRDPEDPQRRKPDISRALEILGWAPSISLSDGLKSTIEDFQSRN